MPSAPPTELAGRTGYQARYRAEHCGIELFVTLEGIPSNVPPVVILTADGHTCMMCHQPVPLELIAAATKLPGITLDDD